ncbi:hypothetical protein ON010_g13695 [Phytophthora cinnamomi]|nr:hypothetical protein ON010_g13695 [Phytophthora cinnamomi]
MCREVRLDTNSVHLRTLTRQDTPLDETIHSTVGSMAFVYQGEDDDARAFEAALSFVEEFAYDVDTESFSAGGVSSEVDSSDSHEHARPKRRGRKQSREDPIKRRDALNAKRKLLRKAGVYGDPNRVRNQRTREIAFLREQIEKLELLRQGQGRQRANQCLEGVRETAETATRGSRGHKCAPEACGRSPPKAGSSFNTVDAEASKSAVHLSTLVLGPCETYQQADRIDAELWQQNNVISLLLVRLSADIDYYRADKRNLGRDTATTVQ